MEKGIYAKSFFNLAENNIYKSTAIKDIDTNIGQLLKTDAKFYAIHVSPSEKELRVMGNTEQEQAEAMKRYIREVFIPEYDKNFNKELSEADIKFYGKIHFDRNRSDNRLNMHCHLIVSRKDQSSKVKISPLTNHRNTKKGVIASGFDHAALCENVEKGFIKLSGYHRQLSEKFEYFNTMKNGPVMDKLCTQKRELNTHEIFLLAKRKKIVDVKTDKNVKTILDTSIQQQTSLIVNQSIHQQTNKSDLSSLLSMLPSVTEIKPTDEQQLLKHKKKKKRRPRLS